MNIIVTAAACAYIEKQLTKKEGIAFRLSIKKTGCSGYSYLPSVEKEIRANDTVFKTDSGLLIYIDTAWLDLLQDIHIDYIEEEKSGLKQKRLIFINPKESNRCGCGESFHV